MNIFYTVKQIAIQVKTLKTVGSLWPRRP